MAVHSDHYALVVGIDDYPRYNSLNGAKQDAKDFTNWLRDTNSGGGLPESNVALVLSKKRPVQPIHEDIDDALEALLDHVGESGGQRFYLYFSGHGLARSNTATDLCLAKWSMRRKGLALDSEDYLSMIMGSGRFREVAMFLDCCRIRKVRSRALPPTIDYSRPGDDAPDSRSFVGYATEFLNAAHEAAVDAQDGNNSGGSIVRGHFTRALIEALRGDAADAHGGVTASRLKDYLEVHTPEIAKLVSHTQQPEVVNGFPANPEPRFGSASPPASPRMVKVVVAFASADQRMFTVEDGRLRIIKRATADSSDWTLSLPRGNYALREEGGTTAENIRVTGHEQEAIDVSV